MVAVNTEMTETVIFLDDMIMMMLMIIKHDKYSHNL